MGVAVGLLVVTSVTTRALLDRPIPGDVELTQLGVALAISLCLPWAQARRAHIMVDFFTQRLAPSQLRRLDGAGALFMAAMCGLLAWRSGMGAWSVKQAGEESMILGLPMWWVYAALAPGLALAGLLALWQAGRALRGATGGPSENLDR